MKNIYLLDIDGVLANFVDNFCKYYNKLGFMNVIEPFNMISMPIEKSIGDDEKTYE